TENAGVPSSSLGLGTRNMGDLAPHGYGARWLFTGRRWGRVTSNVLPMGDRLTAGLRTLDPSIGDRIPVPQHTSLQGQAGEAESSVFVVNGEQDPICLAVCFACHGACSSMAEHQIVDLVVVGSSPIKRPK